MFCAVKKKRKQSPESLANLNKGKGKARRKRACKLNVNDSEGSNVADDVSKPQNDAPAAATAATVDPPKFKDAWTTMNQRYCLARPRAVILSTKRCVDRQRERVTEAHNRIKQARLSKKVRTVEETVMLLQFIFDYIHNYNCVIVL